MLCGSSTEQLKARCLAGFKTKLEKILGVFWDIRISSHMLVCCSVATTLNGDLANMKYLLDAQCHRVLCVA